MLTSALCSHADCVCLEISVVEIITLTYPQCVYMRLFTVTVHVCHILYTIASFLFKGSYISRMCHIKHYDVGLVH